MMFSAKFHDETSELLSEECKKESIDILKHIISTKGTLSVSSSVNVQRQLFISKMTEYESGLKERLEIVKNMDSFKWKMHQSGY